MLSPGREFHYRLALALGRANVDAMLDDLSSFQLAEWEKFDRTYPLIPGLGASLVARALAGDAKSSLESFLPHRVAKKKQTARQLRSAVEQWAAKWNGPKKA
jgi:hypothetical protein